MTATSRSTPWPSSFTALLLLVLLLASTRVGAIYENQAGVKDWHHKWIGRPRFSLFHDNDDQTHLFAATELGVIASLNTTSGDIAWRHILNEPVYALTAKGGNLLSLSGSTARLWEASTGFLVWERATSPNKVVPGTAFFADNGNVLTLTAGSTVQKLSGKKGTVLWKVQLDSPVAFQNLVLTTTGKLYAVGLARPTLHVVELDPATGATVSTHQVSADVSEILVLDLYVIWTDGEKLTIHLLGTGYGSDTPLQSLYSTAPSLQAVASNAEPAVLIAHDTGLVRVNSFILKRVNAAALFKIGKDGAASLIEDLKRKGVSAYASAAGQSGPSILARVERNGEKTLGINIWDTTESPMYRAMYKVDHDFSLTGNIQSVAITIPDKNDAATFRLFLTTADGSVRFIAREGVEWSREEALADIVEAEFLDLPERHLYTQDHDELAEQPQLTEATNPLNRYILRWTTHLNELQYFPAWASARFSNAVASVSAASTLVTLKAQSSLLDSSSVPATIYRDTGGQRKFVISATRSGKVVAQDTGIKGKIAWARYFDGVRLDRVIVVRASTVKFPPVVVAIGSGTDAKGHLTTHLYRLNALTGQDFTTDTAQATQFPAATVLPFAAKQVFRLPFEEPEERNHVLAVVDESTLQLHLYPSTAESQRQLVAFAPNFYFSLNDGIGGGALKGYQVLVGSENKDSKEVKPFGMEMLWNIEFPAGEEVVAFGEKNAYEKVASMGRVLGNRNVLYKYLNPHLLAVATYAEARSALTLYLVDLVKGAILYRASHLNAGGPSRGHTVHIVQAENWVVYTFWVEGDGAKDSARGQQVVTFELFESGFENERVPSVNFSSFNNLRPYVTAQAWIFPYTVSALGATTTRNGITARDFIFVTHTGHVIGINKRFIDPRRPITSKPTNEEKEEMLIPYSPAIPDERRLFYSYNLQVLGVKRILSSPTLLESTSLVFAYGLDTYFTPVAPSKQFDVLSEDFSKTQLLLTMAALVIGIIVTRPMVRRKRVNRLWL